jgi:hypothetical protein
VCYATIADRASMHKHAGGDALLQLLLLQLSTFRRSQYGVCSAFGRVSAGGGVKTRQRPCIYAAGAPCGAASRQWMCLKLGHAGMQAAQYCCCSCARAAASMLTQLGSTSGADEPVRTILSTTLVAMFIYFGAMCSASSLSACHRMARNIRACEFHVGDER